MNRQAKITGEQEASPGVTTGSSHPPFANVKTKSISG